MFYKTGYAFNVGDLFQNWKWNTTEMEKKQAMKVFAYFIRLLIFDIIENNITFIFPTLPRRASIFVKVISGEAFKRWYKDGWFRDIDYLMSDWTGYYMVFRYQTKHGMREKPIYLSRWIRKIWSNKINNGKKYY